jgi:phage terminase Nu1 subunit (DNA packaging protein)
MASQDKSRTLNPNSKYEESFIPKARLACAELGATDADLADLFGVCLRTIHNWKQRHPEFGRVLKEAKEVFDSRQVERSLLQAALGAEYEEIHEQNGKVVKKVTRHKAPDIKACMFWLKNRQPGRWRDKAEMAQELGEDLAQLLNEAKARLRRKQPGCLNPKRQTGGKGGDDERR